MFPVEVSLSLATDVANLQWCCCHLHFTWKKFDFMERVPLVTCVVWKLWKQAIEKIV